MNNTKEYILKPYSDIYSPILSVTIVGIFLYYLTYNLYILLISTFGILLFYSLVRNKSKIELDIKKNEIIIHYTNYFGFKSLKKYSLKETNYSYKLENITSISKREVLRIKKNDKTIVKLVSSENGITDDMLLEIVTLIENYKLSNKAKY